MICKTENDRKIERSISDEAINVVRSKFDAQNDFVIVEGRLLWHIGVVGIVASRVLSQFYRRPHSSSAVKVRRGVVPVAVSWGFDLAAALRECDDLLIKHGGHAMAAGVTIHPDKLDAFRTRLNEIARRSLQPEDLQPPLRLDAEVALKEISLRR